MPYDHLVRINQGRAIRWEFRLLLTFILFFIMLAGLFFLEEFLAILVVLIATVPFLLIWNTYRILQIDLEQQSISTGYWMTGYSWTHKFKYDELGQVMIRKLDPQRDRRGFWVSKRKPYLAFLVLDKKTEIYLLGGQSERQVIESINELSKKSKNLIHIGSLFP